MDLGDTGSCKECQKVIAAKGGSTLNLIKHLVTVHIVPIKDINPSKVSSINRIYQNLFNRNCFKQL